MATQPHSNRCPQCGKSFPSTVRICPDDGTVLEQVSPTAAQIGRILDGKYRLDAFLSHGGMGSVFKATHVMLGRTVAVKLINPDIVTSPEIVRRFQREARAATSLNHPNITGVYDLGQTADGTLYIAMEFIDGPTLKSVLKRGGAMPTARIVAILRQVAAALSTAHRHGVVHRDLKPHNIMLVKDENGRDVAKLVDFGIAKTFDESTQLTQTGFALGTPQYMAPEQAEGKPVDGRSDIYSLGVILYEMLAGEVPFNDQSTPAILIKHIKETPPLPSLRNPGANVSPELEAIAMKCLAKDPADRFQSADEFAAALDAVPLGASAAAASTGSAATLPLGTRAAKAAAPAADGLAPTLVPGAPTAAAPTSPGAARDERTAAAPLPTVAASSPVPPGTATMPAGAQTMPAPPTAPAMGGAAPTIPAATAVPPPAPAAAAPAMPPAAPTATRVSAPAPVASPAAVGASPNVSAPALAASPAPSVATVASAAAPTAPPASKMPLVLILGGALVVAAGAGWFMYGGAIRSGAGTQTSQQAVAQAPAAQPSAPAPSATSADQSAAGGPPASAAATPPSTPASSQPTAAGAAPPNPSAPPAGSSAKESASITAGRPDVSKSERSAASARRSAAAAALPVGAPAARMPAARTSQATPEPPAAPAAPPANPGVAFRCTGPGEVCSAIRNAVDEALQKAGFTSLRNPARADISVDATVTPVEERVTQQFGTTFAVRNYAIDVSGEAPKSGEGVPMPPATTLSYDPKFGSERVNEKARLVADGIVEKVKAYLARTR